MFTDWHHTVDFVCGALTILVISPFLRAMIMKKNRSDEFKALWSDSRLNHLPLIFTVIVRIVIACSFIFYVINYLSRFTGALIVSIAVALVIVMVLSRRLKHSSIKLERMFVNNLRSRDIEAQVHGRKRPLYEGHLLDRDIHMVDLDVPADSLWAGKTLSELGLRNKYGVHVSSILRANRRLNIPAGDAVIFPADRIRVVGSDDQLTSMNRALQDEVYGDDLEFEKREMKLRQMVITGKSPFVGKTLGESGIRDKYNCMVVGLEEGEETLSQIEPGYRFGKGDIIWVVGEEISLNELTEA
jgi:CPA2 family monovalent cation:H+ antiporter-2